MNKKKINIEDKKTTDCKYVVPPAYLWSFKEEEKPKRKSKRYVKNRKYKSYLRGIL